VRDYPGFHPTAALVLAIYKEWRRAAGGPQPFESRPSFRNLKLTVDFDGIFRAIADSACQGDASNDCSPLLEEIT
jgi:hypothetical protein